ncbi:general substrate transporter [Schizophyllum commune]
MSRQDIERMNSATKDEEDGHIEDLPKGKEPLSPAERQEAFEAALKIDPGVKSFSWQALQMYLITLVACCCSGDTGFDGTVMGGINSMWQYQQFFGMTGTGSKTSISHSHCRRPLNSLQSAYLPDRFGRRFSMFFGNTLIIIGAALTANSRNEGMFLGGRFLTGMGGGCAGASAKSFLAELAPPKWRGAYLGFLNSFYYIGQMAATGMMVATGRWDSELAWRLPLYIQMVPAALNFLLVFLCPESPRWLYSVGKADQARQVLANLHSRTRDINSPLIALEMDEIEEKVTIGGADKRWWDFRPLFRTKGDRARMIRVVTVGWFGQLSGNGLITYFLPVLLKQAGITDQNKQLTLNFVNSVTSYIGALAGSFTVDRWGRRKVLFYSTVTITAILAIVTGLLGSNKGGNLMQANAGISFIYLFMVVFSYGWTAMQALYPAEVLGYQARAKGLAFLGIVTQVASCINTFGLPVALDKIGWKVYLIFCIWDLFECVVIWFMMVETKGLTLEEITEVFEQKNPVAYSKELLKHHNQSGLA